MSIRHGNTLLALSVVVVGLAARALVDKMLAQGAGPERVAHWAQLQSVFELVAGVALAGIGQGLTVLAARQAGPGDRLIRDGLLWGLCASAGMALLLAFAMPRLNQWLGRDMVPGVGLGIGAALAGCLSVAPGMFAAYWQGRRWRGRMLLLALLTWLPLVMGAAGLCGTANLHRLLQVQIATQASLAIGLCLTHRHALRFDGAWVRSRLRRYLPAGLSIGLLSPASLLWSRAELAQGLSWAEVAQLQAWWRASEWITGFAASVMFLVYLPRLAVVARGRAFEVEMARIWRAVWVPSTMVLVLLWAGQRDVLTLLYDERFLMPRAASALFLLGDALRIAAWVPLLALFATERVRPVALGEWLSLPLFAASLSLVRVDSLTLAATCYASTYAVYLAFNLYCVRAARPLAPRP